MTRWLFMFNFMQEYFADIFTIQAWRSLWFCMDTFVFKNDSILSATISLSIGILIYLVFHIFNKPINKLAIRKESSVEFIASIETLNNDKMIYKQLKNFPSRQTSMQNDCLIPSEARENMERKNVTLKNKLFLYLIFILGFISTVNIWRGIWAFQLEFCYPILFPSKLLNTNILNLIYLIISLLILWSINLTSAILSRASCEDDYFTAKKNYILKHNNFKHFIYAKVSF